MIESINAILIESINVRTTEVQCSHRTSQLRLLLLFASVKTENIEFNIVADLKRAEEFILTILNVVPIIQCYRPLMAPTGVVVTLAGNCANAF